MNSKPLEVDQAFNEKKDNAIDVESLSDFYEYTPEEERLILLPMLKGEIPTAVSYTHPPSPRDKRQSRMPSSA